MSIQRFSQRVIDEVDEDGNVIRCRECEGRVRRPFLFYCSYTCAHAYRMKTSQQYARQSVIEKYGWQCARCGVDCRELERDYIESEIERTGNKMGVLMRRRKTFANAHHKTAVIEGGGEANSETAFELLCTLCHQRETRDLQARLVKKRRKQRLTVLMVALNAPDHRGTGTTSTELRAVLGRAKTPLLNDLAFLRGKGFVEKDKRHAYYLTASGKAVLARLNAKQPVCKIDADTIARNLAILESFSGGL